MAAEVQAPPKTGTIVHTEIGARDAQKLVDFYGGVFGWHFHGAPGMEDYKMADTGGDAMIAIQSSEEKQGRITNYVSVDDVKRYVEKIATHGGTIAHEFTVPHMGYGAVAFDPEGNPVGVWQADPSARE